MVAEAILSDVNPRACNCRLRLRRGDELLDLVAGCWDCPSHGADKRRSLVEMCETAASPFMLTLTRLQPRAVMRGQEVRPRSFAGCERSTHVREVVDRYGKKSLRWLTRSTCVGCCRRASTMRHKFVKAVRRRWPDFGYLRAIEDHKSSAMHDHWAVIGLPEDCVATLKALWVSLGGGHQVDLSGAAGGNPGRLGRYLGKYLGKRHDQRMARGFRRWQRSRNFAPGVLMAWSQAWREQRREVDPAAVIVQVPRLEVRIVGWVHPEIRSVVSRARLWATAPV